MTAADRPTVPHPDLDTLADLDAGVLDPAAAEDVAAHVGGCERCSAAMAAFDAVRADLRDLPPPALPDRVAARLDATLADLHRGAAGPAPVPAPSARTPGQQLGLPPQAPPPPHLPQPGAAGDRRPRGVADLGTARERRRRSLKLSTGAAAAAFVLVAAGASVTALVTSAGEKQTGTASADNLPGDGAAAPAPGSSAQTVPGIPSYTKETLPGAVDSIRRTSAVDEVTRLGESGPGGAMADRARRQACERSIPREGDRALTAVRRVYFEGVPAYVFVFTPLAGDDPTTYVVTEDCGTGAFAATVLDLVR